MRDYFGEWSIWTPAGSHVQLVAHQLSFINNVAQIVSILHGSGHGECFGAAGALGNGVVELRDADVARDLRILLFELEVGLARCAVRQRILSDPISTQVCSQTRRTTQYQNQNTTKGFHQLKTPF